VKIKLVHKDEDPRDYRVSFDKIKDVLGYETSLSVQEGIKEIITALNRGDFGALDDPKYYN